MYEMDLISEQVSTTCVDDHIFFTLSAHVSPLVTSYFLSVSATFSTSLAYVIQVDRGRYGLATFLKYRGPAFIRNMPRGYLVELVQLLLNKHILVFRKGKVSYAPMGVTSMGLNAPDGLVANSASEGPPLPQEFRKAISRHLAADPRYAGQVTDDPVGVLHFLCYQAAGPGFTPGTRLRKIPVYHYEKSGLLHAVRRYTVLLVYAAFLCACMSLFSPCGCV